MGVLALVDAFAYVHSHDFTGDSNDLQLAMDSEALDKTNFGSGGWKEVAGGVKSNAFDLAGFWQAGADTVDESIYADLGVTARVHTAGPVETEGEVAYLWQGARTNYQLFGAHGELAPFQVTSQGSDGQSGVIRGQLAKAKGTVSAAGALGTALNLGNVGASQYLYGSLHLFGTAGSSITVVLESDDNGGFSSATTRATLGSLTAVGGSWATRTAGALSETHYRYRVTAISGTWTIAGAIGIGS